MRWGVESKRQEATAMQTRKRSTDRRRGPEAIAWMSERKWSDTTVGRATASVCGCVCARYASVRAPC